MHPDTDPLCTAFVDTVTAVATSAGPGVAAARRLAEALVAAYDEPSRHYHGLAHLQAVLRVAEELLDTGHRAPSTRATVQLAAWFHDAVYDARAADNEARSAAWAAATLPSLGVAEVVVDDVVTLVTATATHDLDAVAHLGGGLAFLDADLSILGAAPAVYDGYAAAVRTEYAHVPDDAFRVGRAAVLERFLARDVLFGSPTGRARFERPARNNLARELTALRTSSASGNPDGDR